MRTRLARLLRALADRFEPPEHVQQRAQTAADLDNVVALPRRPTPRELAASRARHPSTHPGDVDL